MSNDEFNPNSVDAKLATIIANQNADREAALEHRRKVCAILERHDGEINGIKQKIAWVSGGVAVAVTAFKSAWDYLSTKGN